MSRHAAAGHLTVGAAARDGGEREAGTQPRLQIRQADARCRRRGRTRPALLLPPSWASVRWPSAPAFSRRSSAARRSACDGRSIRRSPFADNVDAQIFFVARLPRVLAAASSAARWRRGRRLPGAAPQSAGDAVYARRVGRRVARRDAGDHVRRGRCRLLGSSACRWRASPARWRAVAVVYALASARHRGLLDQR